MVQYNPVKLLVESFDNPGKLLLVKECTLMTQIVEKRRERKREKKK